MAIKKIFILLTAASMLMMFACVPKPLPIRAELDTPLHHANNGNQLLKTGKLDAAFSEFARARELDPQYAPACVGLGLVDAFRGDFESGLENLKTANKFAEGKEQRASIHIGHMRFYTVGGEKLDTNWLKRVRSEFEDAVNLIPDRAEPYYYMGMASKQGYEFDKAADIGHRAGFCRGSREGIRPCSENLKSHARQQGRKADCADRKINAGRYGGSVY